MNNSKLYKSVGMIKQWIYAYRYEKHWLNRSRKMKQARTLNEKELNLLLLYIKTRRYADRDRLMTLFAYLAGMRIKEIVSLTIKDVLGIDGEIKNEINLTAEMTKGDKGRTVVLSEKLKKEVKDYLYTQYTESQLIALTYSNKLNTPLFRTQKRGKFDPNTACYHFHMLYKNAGIDGASSHSGRRSFITNLNKKGVSLKVIMELVGHKNLQTTQRYIDVTMDMKKSAVNLIN